MTLQETAQVLAVLKVAFPSSYNNLSIEDANVTVKLWNRQFLDTPYELVMTAVDALIASRLSGFAPTIGEVKQEILMLTQPETLTEKEAWNYILRALPRCGYYAEEEYKKLPKEVQELTTPSELKMWATDSNFNEGVESSNFMRGFREKTKSKREAVMLPKSVTEKLMIEVIDND